MNAPLPSAHELYISVGFKDGDFVFGADGEHPAPATLSADLTAGRDGWTIAAVYLGSQGREPQYQTLSGSVAERAKKLLLDDDGFNDWAARHCRGLEDSERCDAAGVRDFFGGLAAHLANINDGYQAP